MQRSLGFFAWLYFAGLQFKPCIFYSILALHNLVFNSCNSTALTPRWDRCFHRLRLMQQEPTIRPKLDVKPDEACFAVGSKALRRLPQQ